MASGVVLHPMSDFGLTRVLIKWHAATRVLLESQASACTMDTRHVG